MKQNTGSMAAIAFGLLVAMADVPARAGNPVGNAFTFQGQLKQLDVLTNDLCDYEFRLFDTLTNGTQIGPTLTFDGVVPNPGPVNVVDGLFTVKLDFGVGVFDGDARFLDVRVRCPSGLAGYTGLSPRQPICAAPYALFALDGPPDFNLPLDVTLNTAVPVFAITNTFPGGGALVGSAPDGAGVTGTSDNLSGVGVHGIHTGDGTAGLFQNFNGANLADVLKVTTTSAGYGFASVQSGTGGAGRFEIDNPLNCRTVLELLTSGDGDVLTARTAGHFAAAFLTGPGSPLLGSTATLFAANTHTTGEVAHLLNDDNQNPDPTLVARNIGTGNAASFETLDSIIFTRPFDSTVFAVNGRNTDQVAVLVNQNPNNSDETLRAEALGRGGAGVFVIDDLGGGVTGNAADVIKASTNALGRAGFFEINIASPTNNPSPVLEATTNSNGPAGRFSISSPGSAAPGVEIMTDAGGGPALSAITTGGSSAARFAIQNAANSEPGLDVSTDGNGEALVARTSGTNNAAFLLTQTLTNNVPTLLARTFGIGSAGSFSIDNVQTMGAVNNDPALQALTLAFGSAGYFEIDRLFTGTGVEPVNTAPALHVTTNAAGPAGLLESTRTALAGFPTLHVKGAGPDTLAEFEATGGGSGTVIHGTTQGVGPVADFENLNANNASPVVIAFTSGTGPAGRFQVINPSAVSNALEAVANNSRHALFAQQIGAGEAAHFEIADPGSGNRAVFIKNNGTGIALSVENNNTFFAALALGVRGKSAFNGPVNIVGPAGGPVPVSITGDVGITGNLTVSGGQICGPICGPIKQFHIDHPLDPENKYMYHASIESSEMLNVYSGNVVTDGRGRAIVELPEWFEALNTDFRYQLTVIGQFAQAIVAEKILDGRFVIRTNIANVEVSWQVTGVRQDAYARAHPLQVEVDKPEHERGRYLTPEAFGKPRELGVNFVADRRIERPSEPRRCDRRDNDEERCEPPVRPRTGALTELKQQAIGADIH